jgi:hypothetical protein
VRASNQREVPHPTPSKTIQTIGRAGQIFGIPGPGFLFGMQHALEPGVLTVSQASSPAIGIGYIGRAVDGDRRGAVGLATIVTGIHAIVETGRPKRPRSRAALTFPQCDVSQLNEPGCRRVRLTGSLLRPLNPSTRALDYVATAHFPAKWDPVCRKMRPS